MRLDFADVMDFSILILLAATVFLTFRLSLSLRNFKESRFEMEGLVNRLTANIQHAERAVGELQSSARGSGADLDKVIREARALADELGFMNEAGNNLANRLEKLAEKNRELVEKMEQAGGVGPASSSYKTMAASSRNDNFDADVDEALEAGFILQDREFDDDLALETMGLQSQAERDLMEALHKNKARRGRSQ